MSRDEVEQMVAEIAAELGVLATRPGGLADYARVGTRLHRLRVQFQRNRDVLNGHVPRLSQLSRQFEAHLDPRLPEVIDRFHALGEEARRIEDERTYLREFIIRRATQAGLAALRGRNSEVRLRTLHARHMPPAGTPARAQLEELIRRAGLWDEVSQLSRPRLHEALDEQRCGAAAEAIARLCPMTLSHQVTTRAL